MTLRLDTQADLDAGVHQLLRRDPRFKPVVEVAGLPRLRRRPAGFAGLASIIVAQQLSNASANAIWARLAARFDPLHPDMIRRCRATTLAGLGLSAAKIRTFKAIAAAIHKDGLDLDTLADQPIDEADRVLTALHGIGPWTANVYLLFCHGHADAWPGGDLAIQEAARLSFGLKARPNTKEMGPLAEPWRPLRGVAACLLWSYYRAIKKRDAAPVIKS